MIVAGMLHEESDQYLISLNESIPWYSPDDRKFFRKTTANSSMICGNSTYKLDISKINLKDRRCIVLNTKKEGITSEGIIYCMNPIDALFAAKKYYNNINIIGGREIYKLYFNLVNEILLTVIKDKDLKFTYPNSIKLFPYIDSFKWNIIEEIPMNDGVAKKVIHYKRK